MAVYGNVKVKVFIHDATPNIETADVGTMARDIKDHVDTLDSTSNKVLSITHTQLRGDRILTVVIGGA
jgi:hypothetical protein|tara:strand:- start:1362 stop:1565 length:204 start_codon:yes stop_codon:yes gene_type:complete